MFKSLTKIIVCVALSALLLTAQRPVGTGSSGGGGSSSGGGNTTICNGSASATAAICPGVPVPTTYGLGTTTSPYLSGTFIPGATSSGAPLTLNIAGLGAKNVFVGGMATAASNTVTSGTPYSFQYDGTQIQVLSGGGGATPNGSSTDILTSNGAGNFGTPLPVPLVTGKGGTGSTGLNGVRFANGASGDTVVPGTASNCVLVNGTSAACDAPGQAAVANVTPVTVSANTTSAQVLQQLNLTAGLLNVAGNSGGVYTYNGSGIYTAAALQTPTLTWVLNACTVSGCGSGTVRAIATIVTPSVVTATNNTWNIRLHIANTATGASGTLLAHGSAIVELTVASDLGTASSDSNTASTAAIDLTGVIYLQLTVATSTGNAGNTITEDHSSLEPASAIGPTGATGATGPSGVAWVKHEIIINGAGTYTVDGGGTLTIPSSVTTFDAALFTMAAQSTMSRLFMKHSAILTGITNETSLPVSVGVTSPITNRLLFSNGTLDTDSAVSNTNFLVIGGDQTATFAGYGVTVTFSSTCSSGSCFINGLSSGTLDIWVATDALP